MFTKKNGDVSIPKIVGAAVLGAAGLATAWDSFVVLNETERGVDYHMGKMTANLRSPGFSLKAPFLTSVTKVRVDLQDRTYEKQETFTKDNQTIHGDLAITFKIPEGNIIKVYKENPDFETKLRNTVLNATKTMFGQQEAQNIAQNRGEIVKKITEETQKEVAGLLGIEVIKVQLPNFDFDEQFKKAVADAANAKAVLNQKQTELEQQKVEKDKTIVNAQAEAEKQKALADSNAYATKTNSDAQAAANQKLAEAQASGFNAVVKAIGRENVDTYLKTERWNGTVPQVVSGGGSTPVVVPFAPK